MKWFSEKYANYQSISRISLTIIVQSWFFKLNLNLENRAKPFVIYTATDCVHFITLWLAFIMDAVTHAVCSKQQNRKKYVHKFTLILALKYKIAESTGQFKQDVKKVSTTSVWSIQHWSTNFYLIDFVSIGYFSFFFIIHLKWAAT